MNKYYITFGDAQFTIMEESPLAACVNVFRQIFANRITPSIPLYFRISERGFSAREADTYLPMQGVFEEVLRQNEVDDEPDSQ